LEKVSAVGGKILVTAGNGAGKGDWRLGCKSRISAVREKNQGEGQIEHQDSTEIILS
jgi:hypothetical protein